MKVDLDAQRSVLFSGTSCQVAGLEKYLGKEYDNLFCVDIVCTEYRAKKCGTHIYTGKSRKIILKFQVWISVIKKILDGMTM